MQLGFWAEMAKIAQAFGFLLFGGVGAFFTYLAWRQRNADLKEKYYDRRRDVYEDVVRSMSQFIRDPNDFGWMTIMPTARNRARFLFDDDVERCIDDVIGHMEEAMSCRDSESDEERSRAADEILAVDRSFHAINQVFDRYLRP